MLLSVYGDHISMEAEGRRSFSMRAANSTGNLGTSSASTAAVAVASGVGAVGASTAIRGVSFSGTNPTMNSVETRGKLSDAEEFVRIMLKIQPTSSSSNGRGTLSGFPGSGTGSGEFPGVVDRDGGLIRRSGSHLASSPMHGGGDGGGGGAVAGNQVMRRLFTEEAVTVAHKSYNSQASFGSGHRQIPGGVEGCGEAGTGAGTRSPQILRSPPPGFKPDFEA
jgi:hypothetical protein